MAAQCPTCRRRYNGRPGEPTPAHTINLVPCAGEGLPALEVIGTDLIKPPDYGPPLEPLTLEEFCAAVDRITHGRHEQKP